MNSMNDRFRKFGFGGSRRKTNSQNQVPQQQPAISSPPPQLPGIPSSASTSSSSLQQTNQQPVGPVRPPSYSQASTHQQPLARGLVQSPGRAAPSLPPINTSTMNNYPQHAPLGAPPIPPQYAPQIAPAGHPAQHYNPRAVEVEGAGRSKAQLIVGIDFVSLF